MADVNCRKWIILTVMKVTSITEKQTNQNTHFVNNRLSLKTETTKGRKCMLINNDVTADVTCTDWKTLMKNRCKPVSPRPKQDA